MFGDLALALFGARARLLNLFVVELLLVGAGGALYPHKPCRFSAKFCRFSALFVVSREARVDLWVFQRWCPVKKDLSF